MSRISEIPVRVLYSAVATAALPPVLLKAVVSSEWREGLEERLGLGSWRSAETAADLWFHGASLGEVTGIAPIVSAVRRRLPQARILVTTTSVTGRAEVRKRGFSDQSLLLPLDHPLLVGPAVANAAPRLCVIAETELWPNLFTAFRRRNIPIVVVNGRISDRTAASYIRLRSVLHPALAALDLVLAQTEVDAQRYRQIGIAQDRIRVVRSAKYDQSGQVLDNSAKAEFAARLGIARELPCFVAGSVRVGEEEAVIDAFAAARSAAPDLQFIIAPRHPDRFNVVGEMLSARGIDYHRRSNGTMTGRTVLLLDTIGELAEAYSVASVAFVGGTLVDIGGHNPLEPAAYSVPVLVGPYLQNVREPAAELLQLGGMIEVSSAESLRDELRALLSDKQRREKIGAAARAVWENYSGVADKAAELIAGYFV